MKIEDEYDKDQKNRTSNWNISGQFTKGNIEGALYFIRDIFPRINEYFNQFLSGN